MKETWRAMCDYRLHVAHMAFRGNTLSGPPSPRFFTQMEALEAILGWRTWIAMIIPEFVARRGMR